MNNLLSLMGQAPKFIYANVVEVSHNYIEIRFRFGTNGTSIEDPQVDVAVHPVVAKLMLKFLEAEIESYETLVGPIYMPNDVSGLQSLFGMPIGKPTGGLDDGEDK